MRLKYTTRDSKKLMGTDETERDSWGFKRLLETQRN